MLENLLCEPIHKIYNLHPKIYNGPNSTTPFPLPRSGVRQHASDCSHVSRINESRFAQVSLPFGRLLGQDVAFVGLLAADFSTTGNLETLGRSSISLDLRHSSSRILAVPQK